MYGHVHARQTGNFQQIDVRTTKCTNVLLLFFADKHMKVYLYVHSSTHVILRFMLCF